VRFTIDSNVLVYAFMRSDPEKHRAASELMIAAGMLDCVLAAQAIAEYLNVMRRKHPELFEEAQAQAGRWRATFPILDTTAEHVLRAADFAERHRLQFWDSLIWQVARSANATLFLSEDLQDGLSLEGMAVLNPFAAGNEARLKSLLADASAGG
jgi:predicted nucleic acid-binding protein